jgi:RND family efflux transporter MFP subunit
MVFSCGKEASKSKNIEQLYRENGIPVKIQKIIPEDFIVSQTYHAVLSGIEESSGKAMVSDKVDKIHAKVGDYVKKDAVIISFPSDNPTAQYFQAKVAFENAKTSFERFENLFQTGGISRQELDNAKTQYKVAEANWNAVRQSVNVKAPISGYITQIIVSESDNVKSGDLLFIISKINKMKTKLWIPEKEISDFQIGTPALAKWNDLQIVGKVIQIDWSLNKNNKAFGVLVEFDSPGKKMKSGVTAEVRIDTYSNNQAIVVNRKNLIKENNEYSIFLAKNNTAEKRKITLGKTQEMEVEVLSGLTAGEELIVEGQMLLSQGDKINIVQ